MDPGLTRCGVGVVEGATGRALRMVDVGVVRTSADLPIAERLVTIERGLDAWIDEHRPDAVAVERVFAQHNVRTVMGTAQASGIALLVAARRGIPVAMHTPSEVKAAVTGNGRADKAQVSAMVTRLLQLRRAWLRCCGWRCCGCLGCGLCLGGFCPGLRQLSIGAFCSHHGCQRQLPLLLHLLPGPQHALLLLQLVWRDGGCGSCYPRQHRQLH